MLGLRAQGQSEHSRILTACQPVPSAGITALDVIVGDTGAWCALAAEGSSLELWL